MNEEISIENSDQKKEYFWGIPEVIYSIIAMFVISAGILLAVQFFEINDNALMIGYELT